MSDTNPLQTKLRIGTSGYSFEDWVGPYYPRGTARSEFLGFYAREFSVVEVNATYYRIPPPRTLHTMASRTPDSFRFVIKANQEMTHRLSRDSSVYRQFLDAIQPVREAGKFEGVLLQFPFQVHNDPQPRSHLAYLREALPDMPLWVEFRHASWDRTPVFDYLRRLGLGYCAVDEPALENLMPPTTVATSDTGYVRFHGRNARTWWKGGHERYDWEYQPEELGEWLDRLRDLAASTEKTFVFFNNCYMGRAVKGARLLQRLLGLQSVLDLGF